MCFYLEINSYYLFLLYIQSFLYLKKKRIKILFKLSKKIF